MWDFYSSCHSPQNCQGRTARVGGRNPVGFIDQFAQFGGRIVTGDAAVLVPQQSLSVFLRYPSCSKSSAEGVLQIMNADRSKSSWCRAQKTLLKLLRCSDPGFLPCRILHPVNGSGLAVLIGLSVRKHPNRIKPTLSLDDRLGYVVEHHEPLVAVLDPGAFMSVIKICRYEKYAGVELRYP